MKLTDKQVSEVEQFADYRTFNNVYRVKLDLVVECRRDENVRDFLAALGENLAGFQEYLEEQNRPRFIPNNGITEEMREAFQRHPEPVSEKETKENRTNTDPIDSLSFPEDL